MADREREREDSLTERPGADLQSPRCPECACAELTLLQAAEIVTLYKCPKCGHLIAPVKKF